MASRRTVWRGVTKKNRPDALEGWLSDLPGATVRGPSLVHQHADLIHLIPYNLILNSAGVGLYGLDPKGNVTFFNQAATHMLGWKKADLLGKHMHRILHHTRADGSPYPEQDCPIYAALKDGTVHAIYHEVFWTKAGTP
ncbi:MAG: PAS domain-containing protein, partial [Nitrospirae bacterium]